MTVLHVSLQRFEQFVIGRERAALSISTIGLCLAAIVALRTMLELIVANNPMFESLAAFVHYPLAYLAPFVALTLVLAIWSGVAPVRVARLMLWAWLLTLLPPLIDALMHRTRDIPTIGYFGGDASDLPSLFASFFDPRRELPGTTSGIRVETLAAVALGALYVGMRAKSWVRALGAAVTILPTSLFFFTLPVLILAAARLIAPNLTLDVLLRHVGVVWRGQVASSPDAVAVLWLVPLLALLFSIWRRVERRTEEQCFEPASTIVPAWRSMVWCVAGGVIAGLSGAIALFLPESAVLATSPFDALAIPSAAVSLALGVRALSQRSLVAALCAAGSLIVWVALDRAFALPASCAVLALAPWAYGWITPRWWVWFVPICGAIAASASWLAGFCLIVGPEGLARAPISVAAAYGLLGAVCAGWLSRPGLGLISSTGVAATGLAAGAALLGAWGALLIALGIGTLSGGMAFALTGERWRSWRSPLFVLFLTLGSLLLLRGLLASPALAPALRQEVNCVARLFRIQGEESMRQELWGSAATAFAQALACDPNDAGSLRQLGVIARQVDKKYERARDYFERAARANPRSAQEWTNLCGVLIDLRQHQTALEACQQGLALTPRTPALLFNQALALTELARRDEATRAWQRYLEIAVMLPSEARSIEVARQQLRRLDQTP